MNAAGFQGSNDPTGIFCVMLHDVAPRFRREVDVFVETLSPLIGNAMTAAVVPCWGGEPITEQDRPFLDDVQRNFGNIVLHGFTHTRKIGHGLVSRVASGLDEMNGYTPEETDEYLDRGQEALARFFGERARGFIAPTFQIGHASPDRLARHGIDYTVGYRYAVDCLGRRLRLATWCWDVSPIRLLNYGGHWLGEFNYSLRRSAIPCLALHPLDLERGFLPRIVRTVNKLLRAGRSPILFESFGLTATPSVGAH
jgi:predicted deacetylase